MQVAEFRCPGAMVSGPVCSGPTRAGITELISPPTLLPSNGDQHLSNPHTTAA